VRILAISLDLDDTLWPVEPAIRNAEQRLDAWLRAEHPAVAQRFPVAEMRKLRDAIERERPDLAHDFTAQRILTIERAFAADEHGIENSGERDRRCSCEMIRDGCDFLVELVGRDDAIDDAERERALRIDLIAEQAKLERRRPPRANPPPAGRPVRARRHRRRARRSPASRFGRRPVGRHHPRG